MTTPERIGVILMNTGTPASVDIADIRVYLKEFLGDPMVVDLPRVIWLPVLNGIILKTRPKRTSVLYQRIWTPDGSPFMLASLAQSRELEQLLNQHGTAARVAYVSRYGSPRLADALRKLTADGCDRIVMLPLYPQKTLTTTGTCVQHLQETVKTMAGIPPIEVIDSYHLQPAYLDALAQSLLDNEPDIAAEGKHLLFTFHSVPLKHGKPVDSYADDCRATARAVAERLGLDDGAWAVAFQSRFGDSRRWQGPYTLTVLKEWAHADIDDVTVIAPGFATDCLETLVEINEQYREEYEKEFEQTHDGRTPRFSVVPCLNERPDHIAALAQVIEDRLSSSGK